MTDTLTPREAEMLSAIKRIDVPATPESLLKAKPGVVGATLFRASLTDRLQARLQAVARTALRLRMEQLSRRYLGHPWAPNVEYALWRAATGPRTRLTDEEADELLALAFDADGWFTVSDASDLPEFVSAETWKIMYVDYADALTAEGA
jgi:hypothetical protein